MEAAEEIDNGIEPLVHFEIRYTLKALPELFVRVLRDVDRSELLLVHKLLE